MRRHQLAQMLIIGVIASVIGIAVALSIDWFPVQASSQAKKIDDLWDVLLIASVPVFVLVEVVVRTFSPEYGTKSQDNLREPAGHRSSKRSARSRRSLPRAAPSWRLPR